MTTIIKVFGPPGTGKTTMLIDCVRDELKSGVLPEEIVYTSFTKAAATEARDRALKQLGGAYHTDQFCWFSTIHSICFRRLGLSRKDVFTGDNYKNFCNTYGYEISSTSNYDEADSEIQDMVLQTDANYFEFFINWYRNLMIDYDTAFRQFMRTVEIPEGFNRERLTLYIQRRNEYKTKNNQYDFCDMLELVLTQQILPSDNIKVIISDEAQDLSPLLSRVLVMWAGNVERYYIGGDPYQCFPTGSIVECLGDNKPIESVVVGDDVLCASGSGHREFGKVQHTNERDYNGDLIKITTESGKELFSTPEHTLFWYWKWSWAERDEITNGNKWYVYLMKMGNKWRIGKTNSPTVRLRFEHGAEGILPIAVYDTEEDALVWEEIYSLRYGIPGLVFYNRGQWAPNLGLSQEAQDKIWDNINSQDGALRLMNDLNKSWDGHIRPYASSLADIRRNYIHIAVLDNEHDTFSRHVYWNFGVRDGKGGVRGSKYLSSLIDCRDFATQKANEFGAEVFEKWSFTPNHMYLPTPAGNILPGCYVPSYNYGEIIDDLVIRVERMPYNGKVYDLSVEPYNNFVASGVFVHNCLYEFGGASPDILINMKADRVMTLKQSHRCSAAVHDLSRIIVKRMSTRYDDDDFIPTSIAGEIIKTNSGLIKWGQIADKRVFYLHRTHWLISLAYKELVEAGVPFMVLRGRPSPLQGVKSKVANSIYNLINDKSITMSQVDKIMDYVPSKSNNAEYIKLGSKVAVQRLAKDKPLSKVFMSDLHSIGFTSDFTHCLETGDALQPVKMLPEERSYIYRVVKKFGYQQLERPPSIILGTIHCSPPNEPVLLADGSYKPIGELSECDRLVSFDGRSNIMAISGHGARYGRIVKGSSFIMAINHYKGNLIVMKTQCSTCRVTPYHRVRVRFGEDFYNKWVVYLMRRGDWWRIGITRSATRPYTSACIKQRLSAEKADAAWILGVYNTEYDARINEVKLQLHYGLPGITFEASTTKRVCDNDGLAIIHQEINQYIIPRVFALLSDFGLYIDYPLYIRANEQTHQYMSEHWFETVAANVISDMMEVPVWDICDYGLPQPGRSSPYAMAVMVSRQYYDGNVISLNVTPHGYYVSGGQIVHNSVKGMECDVAIVNQNLTRKTAYAMENNPDAEHRLFYVAVTRAKEKVILLTPESVKSYWI